MTKNQNDNAEYQPIITIPNVITSIGLLSGILAIIFSFHSTYRYGSWLGYELCWLFIGISVVCDFCDGLSARLLNAYSETGKNLDSLSDLVTFGLAPALLIFNLIYVYHPHWDFVTWLSLLIPVTGALRLAKFNADPSQKTCFKGLPIPANAIFWIGFSTLLLTSDEMPAWIFTLSVIVISLLMISPIRMFSLKVSDFGLNIVNIKRLVVLIAAIIFLIFLGIQGFMWSIILYIFLSVINNNN